MIGFIKNSIAKHLGENGRRFGQWRKAISALIRRGEESVADTPPAKVESVAKDEFICRYKNYSRYVSVCLFVVCVELYVLVLVSSLAALFTVSLILFTSLMLYLQGSFRLWVARYTLRHWGEESAKKVFRIADFFDAALDDFMEALPVKYNYQR